MIFTEDHAPLFVEMISEWKSAHCRNGAGKIEFIKWVLPIDTRSGYHYVKTNNPNAPRFRTYGTCFTFTVGDYICRNPFDHTTVWVFTEEKFNIMYNE